MLRGMRWLLLLVAGCGRVGFGFSAPHDAGIDAALDARVADAARDAAFDAASEDAASEDADAELPDADAASIDGSVPDADAEAPDAVVPDATTPDADVPDSSLPPSLADGLLVWLPMSSAPTGLQVAPGAGTTFAADCTPACPAFVTLEGRGGLSFDGTTTVSIPWASELDLDGDFTISFYVHSTAVRFSGWLVSRPNGALDSFAVLLGGTEPNLLWSTGYGVTDPMAVVRDRWVHVLVDHASTGLLRIYVDAFLRNSVSGGAPMPIAYTPTPLYIGSSPLDGAEYTGAIRDVRVYTRLLTGAEITYLALDR